jgi:hypothetical protein
MPRYIAGQTAQSGPPVNIRDGNPAWGGDDAQSSVCPEPDHPPHSRMQRLNVFTIRRKPITPFENARRSVLSALSAARTRRSNFEFPFFQKWQRRPVKAALVTSNLAATTPPAAVDVVFRPPPRRPPRVPRRAWPPQLRRGLRQGTSALFVASRCSLPSLLSFINAPAQSGECDR